MRIAPGQTSNGSSPILQIYVIGADGLMADPFSIQYQIWDVSSDAAIATPVRIYPEVLVPDDAPRADVEVDDAWPTGDRLSKGVFAPQWTPASDLAVGQYQLRSFVVLNDGDAEVEYRQDIEVASFSAGVFEYAYSSVSEMRAEGVSDAIGDLRLFKALVMATRRIEQITKQFFVPRRQTLDLDGQGVPHINTGIPIIGVETIVADIFSIDVTLVDQIGYRVYNRHLRGLQNPDDRHWPRIEMSPTSLLGNWTYPWIQDGPADDIRIGSRFRFPRGRQNVHVTGIFGYTDPDASSTGGTPADIAWATRRLAFQFLPQQARRAQVDSAERDRMVISETTRDQSYKLSDKAFGAAPFTGDPFLDTVLLRYLRGPASSVA